METATGARLLGEIEEASLEEILHDLRSVLTFEATTTGNTAPTQNQPQATKLTHIKYLDHVAARHFQSTASSNISLSGRHLPLLYRIISSLVSPPHLYTLLVIDLDGRFDVCRLSCNNAHLSHIYVQQPVWGSTDHLRAMVADSESFMLYGEGARMSGARRWWGTIVLGALGAGDIATGWKGWLRIDREHIREFALGISAEEAMEQRVRRQDAVNTAGWSATSEWGGFTFKEADNSDTGDEEERNKNESKVSS